MNKSNFWWSLQIGKIAGIPLRFHWSLPLPLILFAGSQSLIHGWPQGVLPLITIPTAFLIVTLHELGHCAAAKLFHIPVESITLTGIGGIAKIIPKPNQSPQESLVVSVSGPLINILLFLFALPLFGLPSIEALKGFTENPFARWEGIYAQAFVINGVLLAFNLIPVYPMDGGRILKETGEIWLGKRAGAFLALTACMAIGVPTAILMATHHLVMGATIISMMSFLGILENLRGIQTPDPKRGHETEEDKDPETEPYNEENLKHQEPVQAVSEWQQWNDVDGTDSVAFEKDLQNCQEKESQDKQS